jgi:hypothetical protein
MMMATETVREPGNVNDSLYSPVRPTVENNSKFMSFCQQSHLQE